MQGWEQLPLPATYEEPLGEGEIAPEQEVGGWTNSSEAPCSCAFLFPPSAFVCVILTLRSSTTSNLSICWGHTSRSKWPHQQYMYVQS